MKLHIVNLNTTKYSTLSRYSSKALKEGNSIYIYHDGINFTRDLIRTIQNPPKEMVVLCGKENYIENALKIASKFREVFPSITTLEAQV